MPTFIDGIAASENIDSSGERIIIAGLDCSSLEKDGVFNYEHKNDQPNQVVGKILKARKIFSEADAEDDRQLHYFKKCGVPYLYVMGELFDDYKDSARDIAGMFRYDADKKGQNERNVMNFSIEGAKIDKQGMDIPRSIARKVTITVLPCNKVAEANMVPAATKKPKDNPDNIFKTETGIEIELFKPQAGAEIVTMQKTETANPKGTVLGRTTSGKDVFSHGRVGDYTGFSSADHREAGEFHTQAGRKSGDAKLMAHHQGKAGLHLQAAGTAEKRETRGQAPTMSNAKVKMSTSTNKFVDIPGKRTIAKSEGGPKIPQTHEEHEAHIDMHAARVAAAKQKMIASKKVAHKSDKHLTAHNANIDAYTACADAHHGAIQGHIEFIKKGLGMDKAESNKSDWDSLKQKTLAADKRDMKKVATSSKKWAAKATPAPKAPKLDKAETAGSAMGAPSTLTGMAALGKEDLAGKKKKKSNLLQRAEEAYNSWEKKEQFRAYMQKKLPTLAMGEIDAIGQTMALKKTLVAEGNLAKMAGMQKALKFEHPAGHGGSKEDATPKALPEKYREHHRKEFKGTFDSEIEHVQPHYDGKSHDTVYLKSGHSSGGHPKGKFKVGDKVTAKQHIMGTHILEHKK